MSNGEATPNHRIVCFVFAGRETAAARSKELEEGEAFKTHRVSASAVVEIDQQGKSHVHEAGRGLLGAGVGLVTAGVFGLLGGPVGVLALAVGGAVVGGIAGHHAGRPIPTEDLNRLAGYLQPDSSALLALVEEPQVDDLIAALAGYDARVVVLTVSEDDSGELHVATAMPGEPKSLAEATPGQMHHAAALPGQAPPHGSQSVDVA